MSTRRIERDDSSRLEHVLKVGMRSMAISGFGPNRSTTYQAPQKIAADLADELLAIELPPQDDGTDSNEFYAKSFNPLEKGTAIALKKMATAIKDGYALSSGTGWDNVVIRTRKDYLVGRVDYWQTLIKANKGLELIGEGTYNQVFLMKPNEPLLNRIDQEFGNVLQTGGANTGKIVLRVGKLAFEETGDPDDDENVVTAKESLKELYIGGYASHYGIGPTILASYYKMFPNQHTNTIEYEEILKTTMTAIVAWDGNCSQMLLQGGPKEPNGAYQIRSIDRVKQFCKLYMELLIKAAEVGLFHGDTKLANLLYTMNMYEKGDAVVNSMKICMTDFDSGFCVLIPPKDRVCHNKECIVVACVCMLLGGIRCDHGDDIWRPFKDAMRDELARNLLAGDTCIMPKDANTLCTFLQNSTYMQRDQRVEPIHEKHASEAGYSGQLLLVSEAFQVNTQHYMSIRLAEAQWEQNKRYCMLMTKHDSLFEKVVSYALEESPQMLLQREAPKRKRESGDSSARPTRRVAR